MSDPNFAGWRARERRERYTRSAQHNEEVQQTRQVSGFKARWGIAWSQVVGILFAAAIVGGLLVWSLQHMLR